MSLLLADLYAFYLEHRRCGELESEVTEVRAGLVPEKTKGPSRFRPGPSS